jgi:hypothetical protein
MSLPITRSLQRRRLPAWTSSAAPDRERLMPPWLALALGAITAIALALTFRYEGVEQRVLRDAPNPDALHIAYMSAWLAAHPSEHGLRLRLARDLTRIGRFDDAHGWLAPLQTQLDALEPALAERVALQGLDTDIAALFALAPADTRRAERLAIVHARLERMTQRAWSAAAEAQLAEQAASVGAVFPAAHWYARALERHGAQPASWWMQAGRNMLALRDAALAARLYLRARAASRTLEAERNAFIAALQALRGANRIDEALVLAEAQLGRLIGDTATLEYLTRLALAAGRPDVAQRYATLMLKLSLLHDDAAAWRVRSDAPLPPALQRLLAALEELLPPSLVRVQAEADDERRPRLPFDDARYRLSFEVFLANGNLRDAIAVARAAVRHAPRSLEWRRRLAQAADFNGDAPLALEQWHAIAQQTGDDAAWTQVEKRAPAVFDYRRWLDAVERRLQKNPDDPVLLSRMVELHELLGEPERAIAAVPQYAHGPRRAAVLRELADLAARAGNIQVQRETLLTLNREFGPNPEYATALAGIELARDDRAAAFAALKSAERTAGPADVAYWEAYADLALSAGDRAAALRALLLLIDGGRASTNVLLDAASLLEQDAPARAAELVLRAHQLAPSVLLANRLLAQYGRSGDRAAAAAFLAQLTPAQRAAYEQNTGFLQQRALLWLARDEPARAVADMTAARRLAPANADLTALLLWSLVAARDAPALRALLADSAPRAADAQELWGPVGAAWLALNEPARALPWLERQVKARPVDALWWLNLADATELTGDADRGWRLRHHAWRLLRRQPPASAEQQHELRARLASLAPVFEPGDAARARLRALLRDRTDAATRDAVLSILLATERSDAARAWLLARYARAQARPAWAELSVALAHDDHARLDELLDSAADWLPLADRAEAAQRTGRFALAQTLAFDGLAAQPASDSLHARLAASALPHADFIGASAQRFAQRPLRETAFGAEAQQSVTPRVRVTAAQRTVTRAGTDEALLVANLPTEHATVLGFDALVGNAAHVRVQTEHRDALRAGTGVLLEVEFDPVRDVRLTASAAQRATATDSAYLRAAGTRDAVSLAAQVQLSTREFATAEAAAYRYRSDGARIGSARLVRLEAGHRLRLAYPDLTVRASLTDLRTSAEPGVAATLAALLPDALRPTATNATFLPADATRLALAAVAGDSAPATPQRTWRPFGSVALVATHTRDGGPLAARNGLSYEWSLGVAGSALGTDQLLLTIDGGSSTGANANRYTQAGIRYRWLH